MGADTISLDPQYEETFLELGRLYQKYAVANNIYWVPIDEAEDERQNIEDDVLSGAFDNRLFFGDLPTSPSKVLDLGYGQAIWASNVAREYPDCEVTGVDIRPLDLLAYPDNLTLECDDLNNHLTDVYAVDTFDVIQSRLVSPGIHKNRWPSYLQELRRLITPTGHVQCVEYYFNIQSHSGLITPSSALWRWSELYRQATERQNRDPRIGNKLVALFNAAGFASVQTKFYELPIGPWPTDAKQKAIGERNLENIEMMLFSFGLWGMVKVLGMAEDEVRQLCEDARAELRGDHGERVKAYMPCTVVWGGKGMAPPPPPPPPPP